MAKDDSQVGSAPLAQSLQGVAAIEHAKRLEPVAVLSGSFVRLCGICGVVFLGATILGYDASLMSTLIAFPAFQAQFGARILGVEAAYVIAMFAIGGACALPFVGPLGDTWGRRAGVMTGCALIVLGTILQGTAHGLPQYLGGRFFIGFGSGVGGSATAYIVELAHPAYRGSMAGLFNCFYYLGSLLSAVVLRGALGYLGSSRSWLVPTWFQLAMPAVVFCCLPFFPESPRWLFSHGKRDKCRDVLVKYHGNGNPDSVWVKLQMLEFETEIERDGADKRFWDYRVLFSSRANLYRAVLCAGAVPAFAQITGQGALSYFLPAVLKTAGVTAVKDIVNLNIGIAVVSGVSAVSGTFCLDLFGRRRILVGCCVALVLMWVGMTVATQQVSADPGNKSAGRGAIAMIFLVNVVFSVGYTPLQQLYPVECLSYEQRAKGIAFASFSTSAFALINLFATPIAIEHIGWKTFAIWIGTCAAQAVYYYFVIVETKGRTLEEMNYIFAQRNPRSASLLSKAELEGSGTVVEKVAAKDLVA